MLEWFSTKFMHVVIMLLGLFAHFEYNVQKDVTLGSNYTQHADIYKPHMCESRSIIIFFYGGSWRTGSKDGAAYVGGALARMGFVGVIPEYRHYPSVDLSEILTDNATAVAWVIAHASSICGDPRRVFLAGHSSGAWSALMLALDGKWLAQAGLRPSAVAGVIGMSGPYLTSSLTESGDKAIAAAVGVDMWPISKCPSTSPAILLLAGDADTDVLPLSTTLFSAHMQRCGVKVEAHVFAGIGHNQILDAVSISSVLRSSVSDHFENFVNNTKTENSLNIESNTQD